jgi:DNA-binding transcriptional ArsR family regulator
VQAIEVITDPATAVIALDPVRARLLTELREPASAAALAQRVGLARQKINYHLRALAAHGLVEETGTRRWGGLTERLLRATAMGYVVAPDAVSATATDPSRTPDRLSAAYLVALAARMVREVGDLAGRATRQDYRLATFALDTEIRFRSPADRAAFADELATAITTLVARYHCDNEQGRWHRLVAAAHPKPTKEQT